MDKKPKNGSLSWVNVVESSGHLDDVTQAAWRPVMFVVCAFCYIQASAWWTEQSCGFENVTGASIRIRLVSEILFSSELSLFGANKLKQNQKKSPG